MKKPLDFELNLLPVISLLAVCISFLLLTVVWTPIASVDLKQSMGVENIKKGEALSIWVQFEKNNILKVYLKDQDNNTVSKVRSYRLSRNTWVQRVKNWTKGNKKIQSAIVAPMLTTSYEDIIKVMDEVKNQSRLDVGVAPI